MDDVAKKPKPPPAIICPVCEPTQQAAARHCSHCTDYDCGQCLYTTYARYKDKAWRVTRSVQLGPRTSKKEE
jgi:hypothetical protein